LIFFKNPNQDDQDAILATTFFKLKLPQQLDSYIIKQGILPNSIPSCLTVVRSGNIQSISFDYNNGGSIWSVSTTALTANLHARLSSSNLHLLS
jgi:hypothetical protein